MKKKNLLMTVVAILGLSTITSAQVPNYVPTNGLVGWWPFNGNASDESLNGNNGTVNGPILTTDRFGNANKAYYFDGINDEINCGNGPNLNQFSNDLTVTAWVIAPTSVNTDKNILSKYGCNPGGWSLETAQNTFAVNFTGCGQNIVNQNSLYTNLWTQVIGVRVNNKWKIFTNGILSDSSIIYTNYNLNSAYDLIIGVQNSTLNPSTHWEGKIDDIGIWNRALTQQEITDLYNGCQLSVSTQPINQSVNISNNAQFTTASSDPLATYQWQTDLGVGFQNLNNVGQYSGTANDTITIANTTLSNNNQPFRCIISSGSCTDTSNVAVLTVNNNVGINEFTQDNLFSVYPNPAKHVINVKAEAKLLGSIYTVYDNKGKVVLSGKIIAENTVIELGNLSGGIYLFSVGENMKQTFKVIKE